MSIYTKTGDAGDTSLYGGERRAKDDVRIEAYGAVDELNAHLGFCAAVLQDPTLTDIHDILIRLQQCNFILGAQLARTETNEARKDPVITDQEVAFCEQIIDRLEGELPPLRNFILPGGSLGGAALHVARAVSRRAERAIIRLHKTEPVDATVIRYINRLSDLLFVLARAVNARAGVAETIWKNPQS